MCGDCSEGGGAEGGDGELASMAFSNGVAADRGMYGCKGCVGGQASVVSVDSWYDDSDGGNVDGRVGDGIDCGCICF